MIKLENQNERSLLIKVRDAKLKKEAAEAALEQAEKEYYAAENTLIEALDAQSQDRTGTYEGIGYARVVKPRLYASFKKEDEDNVFGFLKKNGRGDLIKPSVHPASLSGYIAEVIESGEKVPETISYYLKRSIRIY